jgi:hypothetical protein
MGYLFDLKPSPFSGILFMRLLRFDLSGSIDASFGLTQDQIDATAPKWEELRERMLAPDDNDDADDAGFLSLPEQQLVACEVHPRFAAASAP